MKSPLRRVGIGLLLAVALSIAVAAYYRDHIAWYRNPIRTSVTSTPVSKMPIPERDGTWYRCRIGSLTFDIPESLYGGAPPRPHSESARVFPFDGPELELHVILPNDNSEFARDFHKHLPPGIRTLQLSIPRVYARAYEADGADFRWSMSPAELEAHKQLIVINLGLAATDVQRVETRWDADAIEGLLKIMSDDLAVFEWYSADERAFGSIAFESKDGKLDLDIVRAVCVSLVFSGEVYPERLSEEEVQPLVERAKVDPIRGVDHSP